MQYYTIDRIEENTAVLFDDDGNKTEINTKDLPAGIREGYILRLENNGGYIIDYEKTKQIKEQIDKKFKSLFKNRSN